MPHSPAYHGSVIALMDRLRSVLNASARLIYASRRTEHVTPLLRDLHWLRYPDRIDYKLAVLVYRCHGLAPGSPGYLADEFTRVSEIVSRLHLAAAGLLITPYCPNIQKCVFSALISMVLYCLTHEIIPVSLRDTLKSESMRYDRDSRNKRIQ